MKVPNEFHLLVHQLSPPTNRMNIFSKPNTDSFGWRDDLLAKSICIGIFFLLLAVMTQDVAAPS